MFKIPKWGDDIPKSNVDFGMGKSPKNKNKGTKADTTSTVPQKIFKTPNNPYESNKTLNKKIHKNKKSSVSTNVNKTILSKRNLEQNGKLLNSKKNKTNFKKKNNRLNNANGIQTNFVKKQEPFVENSMPSISKTKTKSRKRKQVNASINDTSQDDNEEYPQKPSKVKKKKMNSIIQSNSAGPLESLKNNDSDSHINKTHMKKVDKKKEKIKMMLQIESNRNQINVVSSNNLRQRMLERLKAAQFRFLNEKLYTTSGSEAQKLFQSDPDAFHTYHQGYQLQVKKWPVNPLDLIVQRISKMPKTHLVADMGCGEGALSTRVPHKVRSFDLVSTRPEVEACDMAHTPLLSASVDVAVYCLALMGTDLTQYLMEANRVLKMGGHLLIAEVESRFDKVETFTEEVQRLGFKLKNLDKSHTVFFFMEFTKIRDPPAKKSKLPSLTLKPCLYKKR